MGSWVLLADRGVPRETCCPSFRLLDRRSWGTRRLGGGEGKNILPQLVPGTACGAYDGGVPLGTGTEGDTGGIGERGGACPPSGPW